MSILLAIVALQGATTFQATHGAFSGCLVGVVQAGMMARVPPAEFEARFAKSCLLEEAAFRAEAIRLTIEQGRTAEAAAAEVDSNIAKGRRIFARDQAAFIATGKVPR
jgi:hypothetical protein